MTTPTISWPTALVLCVALLAITALLYSGRHVDAATAGAIGTVAAAFCRGLLQPAAPAQKEGEK